MKIKIGMIFGGNDQASIDKSISLVEHIDKNKYDVVPIYISEKQIWYSGKMLLEKDIYRYFDDLKKYARQICLVKKKNHFFIQTVGKLKKDISVIDIVLPMIDDDMIIGYLKTMGIPYIGSVSLSDKFILKEVLKSQDIATLDWKMYKESVSLKYPVLIKENGKKIKVKTENELKEKINNSDLIIEEYIKDAYKVNLVLLGDSKEQDVGILKDNEDESEEDINQELVNTMTDIAKKIFNLLKVVGLLKVEFIIDKDNIYVDDISTVIDLQSLYALDKKHKNYTNLIDDVISITVENYKEKINS